MGIYDRDYYRSSTQSAHGRFGGDATVCKWLIAINIGVFVLQILTQRPASPELVFFGIEDGDEPHVVVRGQLGGVTEWLQLDPQAVFGRLQIWRLVTSAFCHSFSPAEALPWHLLVNMLLLWWFGTRLEPMYGSAEFLRFYLTAAVVASCCYLGLSLFLGQVWPMIGASGAVGGVVVLYTTYYPRARMFLFFLIPIELRWIVALYVISDLYPVLMELGGAQTWSGVAHAAHLGGFAYGYLYRRYDLRFYRLFPEGLHFRLPRLRNRFRRSQVRIYREPDAEVLPDNFDAKVDQVLAKISRDGADSLTAEEKRILELASIRYRKQQIS